MTPGLASLELKQLHLHQGARHGLRQRTAVVSLTYVGELGDIGIFDRKLGELLAKLDADGSRPPLSTSREPEVACDAALALARRVADLLILLQRWIGEPVIDERWTRARPGQLIAAVPWSQEVSLRRALAMTVQLILQVGSTATGREAPWHMKAAFAEWLRDGRAIGLPTMPFLLALAALERDHPVEPCPGYLRIGWGARARRLTNTMSGSTGAIAVRTARNKQFTNRLLAEAGLPVPKSIPVANGEQARQAAALIGWPVVVKPANLDGGVAITTDIRDLEALSLAVAAALASGANPILVEEHVAGDDHRLLVMGGKLVAASRRTPGGVVGDSHRAITDLLRELNADPARSTADQKDKLVRIEFDDEARRLLREQGLTPGSVPAAGHYVRLRKAANISVGGTSADVTDRVHPDNRDLAIRAARVIGLDIAGIDLICPDIGRSWLEVGGGICEVNSQPALRLHKIDDPARNFEGETIDRLTGGQTTRIPTAAVLGGGGDTAAALMLHQIWRASGKISGACTVAGLWLGDERAGTQDFAGCRGARALFADPGIEAAVIELPHARLTDEGHPCDRYDVVAVVGSPRKGPGEARSDRESAEERVIAETLARLRTAAVVHAGDRSCMAQLHRLGCRQLLLVADRASMPAMSGHLERGGTGFLVEEDGGILSISLATVRQVTMLARFEASSLKTRAPLQFRPSDLAFAAAMAHAHGLGGDAIGLGLSRFFGLPLAMPAI